MDLKAQNWGIEIETVQRTREQVARAIHSVVGGEVRHVGYPAPLDPWEIQDPRGRIWKVVADASLTSAPPNLRAEIVSPIMEYNDMNELQEIIRAVRRVGAKVDARCGIHVHVASAPFDGRALANLAKIVYKQEPIILHALGVSQDRLARYTRPISDEFIQRIERAKPRTKDELNPLWYGQRNNAPEHYHVSRYAGLNLHNVWYRSTIEWRWFESTLHSGKIRSYVTLCLALAAKALNARAACSHKRVFNAESAKFDMRVLLIRLGLIGEEYRNVRKHLLERMPGDAAFKHGRPKRQKQEAGMTDQPTEPAIPQDQNEVAEVGAGDSTRPQ